MSNLQQPDTTAGSLNACASSAAEAAWQRFHTTMRELHDMVTGSEMFVSTPQQRAKGYQMLLMVQAMAYNFALAPRLAHPRLFHNLTWQTDVYAIGGGAPDFHYGVAFLDGKGHYRLHGQFRDSKMVLAQLNRELPGTPGARCLANHDLTSLARPGGSFEIHLSPEKSAEHWIPLQQDCPYHWLFIRATAETWNERPADIRIDRVGDFDTEYYRNIEFDEEDTARRIDAGAAFAAYMVRQWSVLYMQTTLAAGINKFTPIPEDVAGEVASPSSEYVSTVFSIEDDEALILTLPSKPSGMYWNYQLTDVWTSSIDFRTRQSTLNHRQVVIDTDGKIRVVVAHRDPQYRNWLDTGGYRKGQLLFRHYRYQRPMVPETRRVKFAEIDRYLGAGSPRMTLHERAAELQSRRDAYLFRLGE